MKEKIRKATERICIYHRRVVAKKISFLLRPQEPYPPVHIPGGYLTNSSTWQWRKTHHFWIMIPSENYTLHRENRCDRGHTEYVVVCDRLTMFCNSSHRYFLLAWLVGWLSMHSLHSFIHPLDLHYFFTTNHKVCPK